ncbi:MAG: hypothetical protein ACTSYF_14210, partial [Promethearchaeota archaeon]
LRISSLSNELDASRMKETELRKKLFSSKKGNGKGRIPKETMLLAQDIKSSGMDERIKGPIFEFLKFDQEHARAIDAVFKKNHLLGFVAFNKNDFTYLNSLRNKYRSPSFIYLPKAMGSFSFNRKKISYPGVIDYLFHLIQAPGWLNGVVADIVRDTIVVDSFATAVSLIKEDWRAKCVTLDGIIVDAGKRTLKSAPKYYGPTFLVSNREDDGQSIELILNQLVSKNKKRENELRILDSKKKMLEKKIQDVNIIQIKLKQLKAFNKKKIELNAQKGDLEKEKEALMEKLNEFKKELKKCKEQKPKNLKNYFEELSRTQDNLNAINQEIHQLEGDKSKIQEEINKFDYDLKLEKKKLVDVDEEFNKLKKNIDELAKEVEQLISMEEKIKETIKVLEAEKLNKASLKDNYMVEMQEKEEHKKALSYTKSRIIEEINTLKANHASLNKEKEYIEKYLKDRIKPRELKSIEDYDAIIFDLQESLRSPKFFYISEELEKEFEDNKKKLEYIFMKLDEINSEKDKLNEINESLKQDYLVKMNEISKKLEDNVNQKFLELDVPFRVLFENSGGFNNPTFDIGVDFFEGYVYPISALSEGQKSIVALALMLTLQDLSPGPLCFFDEAHIFLDDSNKELISRLIKKTTSNIQLIMIVPTTSHGFLKFADKIVGITRQGLVKKAGEIEGHSGAKESITLGPSKVVEYL